MRSSNGNMGTVSTHPQNERQKSPTVAVTEKQVLSYLSLVPVVCFPDIFRMVDPTFINSVSKNYIESIEVLRQGFKFAVRIFPNKSVSLQSPLSNPQLSVAKIPAWHCPSPNSISSNAVRTTVASIKIITWINTVLFRFPATCGHFIIFDNDYNTHDITALIN